MHDTMLAFISPGQVSAQTFATLMTQGPFGGVWPLGGVQRIWAMDAAIRGFLQTEFEWWFQIDTDLQFPPDAYAKLRAAASVEEGRRMVSGVYFDDKNGWVQPIYGRWDGQIVDGAGIFEKPDDIRPWVEESRLIEMDFVPEGCLLIHRSVFEEVLAMYGDDHTYPFFYETLPEHGGVRWWEEATFFLRAKEATGEKPWVHHGVICNHIKQRIITYETYQEGLR